MSVPIKKNTFAGGEIAPAAYARSDLALYEKSARTLRNMICQKHGGVTGRPGTMYVGTTLNGGAAVRLIPFIFNETGLGQAYVLEFGNLYIAFYQNGGVVLSGGNPYTIVSPYLQADLASLKFAQCADIITIVHPSYPIAEVARIGPINWTLTQLNAIGSLGAPVGFPIGHQSVTITGTAGSATLSYAVTAVNGQGEESDINVAGGRGTYATGTQGSLTAPALASPISLSWFAVTGAVYYKIYVGSPGATPTTWGYIGRTNQTGFTDTGFSPDYTNSPPLTQTISVAGPGGKGSVSLLFGTAGNYPSAVGFVQQRRCFAATNNNLIGFYMSVPGDFYNFDTHLTQQNSDGIFATLFGSEMNQIQHLEELKFMLILTTGSEIYVQGNGTGVVTPSSINASTQSQYGSSSLKPLRAGDVLIFNQALGSFVRDFAFDFAIDGYRGNDISIYAAHLFEGYQLVDWTYQKIPDSLIWAVRSDGQLLSCTYIREQQILAWTHHDMTNGFVENICAIPENGQYGVYMSVRRVINGATVRYIERLSQRLWQGPSGAVTTGTANSVGDPIDAPFCDSSSQYDGRNGGSVTMTLTASGGFQTGSTAYQQLLNLTASTPYFGVGQTAQVGDQILLQDANFVNQNVPLFVGGLGNQTRLTIQAIQSSTVATVTPEGPVPTIFQAVATKIWARAVKTVSGLGYLAGQKVSVWADRTIVGSPLNSHIVTVYTVAANGTLTLDKPYSVIWVGLPMIQDIETLDLETYFGETILGRRKRMAGLTGYLYNTRSFYAGSENPDYNVQNKTNDSLFQLFPIRTGISQLKYDQPPELLTTQDYLITTARWNKRGSIFMRNVDPVPWTLLAVSPREEDAVTTPYKRL